ncbi:MAG: OmpA family protein [Phycisphaeraceae bacterium]|nr:OmpA family protein [Phycisphaeraceae bacterium]
MTRSRMSRFSVATLAGGAAALATLAGGCVNQESYDQLREANASLKARNQELLDQNRALEASMNDIRGRIGTGDKTVDELQRLVNEYRDQLAKANNRLRELDGKFGQLGFGPLDSATDAALQELAAKNPGLLSYDSARGMLRFTSDVTFDSGDFTLRGEARSTIASLARILLETPSAAQYDAVVVGHTDTQRVSQRPGRRFINNDELSAFRALSVHNELIANGLARHKVMFAGFGESRPAVANNPNGNTPQNRRVEVYLVKSTFGGLEATAPTAGPSGAAPAAPASPGKGAVPDIMK